MKKKITHYIYIAFLLISFQGFFAQDFYLKLTSKNKSELLILEKIDFQEKHKDSITIFKEVDKISNYLKNIGYFTNTIDSIKKIKKKYIAYFSLNYKVDKAVIKINKKDNFLFKKIEKENNKIIISIKKLQITLSDISKNLDKEGKSFSKVQLKNILIKNNTLFADLDIYRSKKRIINKVIIKGYENFPKSYLRNYFNIKPNTIINQQKIKEISDLSKNIQFIKVIKPPEILFTKDSTLLYMFLRKQQNNSFDGIINFASKENGKVLFNGNIDLKLNNILNTGEKFNLFWNSIGEERQEFKISTEIPYIFNSKFSPKLSFSIYKQDSSFINTKFDSELFYNINSKTRIALIYNSESSENLEETINNNIETFENYFFGFQFRYNIPKNDYFFNNTFYLEVNPTFGKRNTSANSLNQFKIKTIISYLWNLNSNNSIFIKNETGYLNSDSFIDNEVFRIGGANSLRGFNEQSIFTNNYSYFNIEYRINTSNKSYLYSITDFAKVKANLNVNYLLGIGLGYRFFTKKSLINVGIVNGNNIKSTLNFKQTKFILSFINYF
ncbi:MAG: POTRA domain-containing protein [Polaribacter sp.]